MAYVRKRDIRKLRQAAADERDRELRRLIADQERDLDMGDRVAVERFISLDMPLPSSGGTLSIADTVGVPDLAIEELVGDGDTWVRYVKCRYLDGGDDELIHDLVVRQGLSLVEVAKKLGVTSRTISRRLKRFIGAPAPPPPTEFTIHCWTSRRCVARPEGRAS